MANEDDDKYIVYCYNPSQDNWTNLPPCPVKWFGLGQVNGKVVAVGGSKKGDNRATNEVFTYDERSRKWKQTLPPMPTAKHSPGVLYGGREIAFGNRRRESTFTVGSQISHSRIDVHGRQSDIAFENRRSRSADQISHSRIDIHGRQTRYRIRESTFTVGSVHPLQYPSRPP